MKGIRLTKKERAALYTILEDGFHNTHQLLLVLNCEGGYNYEELYTAEEINRIGDWICNKCGV
tara:strand:+ start:175 stop:363 length:189 start_codon:yes stop_codon:yes gene_type:complete